MSQLTKQAILSAFLDLLDEKPFDRISVVDIAQRSRINRNTFYYYYPDIFALVDDLLRVSSRELLERKPPGNDVERNPAGDHDLCPGAPVGGVPPVSIPESRPHRALSVRHHPDRHGGPAGIGGEGPGRAPARSARALRVLCVGHTGAAHALAARRNARRRRGIPCGHLAAPGGKHPHPTPGRPPLTHSPYNTFWILPKFWAVSLFCLYPSAACIRINSITRTERNQMKGGTKMNGERIPGIMKSNKPEEA